MKRVYSNPKLQTLCENVHRIYRHVIEMLNVLLCMQEVV